MVITVDILLKICAGISCVGLALSYLIKTIKTLFKPADEYIKKIQKHDELFANDKKRLDNIESIITDIRECTMLLLESQVATLEHLEDGNHTKMLQEKKNKIDKFLYEHVGGVK